VCAGAKPRSPGVQVRVGQGPEIYRILSDATGRIARATRTFQMEATPTIFELAFEFKDPSLWYPEFSPISLS